MPRKSPISPSLPVLPVAAAPPFVSAPPWLLPTVHSALSLSLHTRTNKQHGGFFSSFSLFSFVSTYFLDRRPGLPRLYLFHLSLGHYSRKTPTLINPIITD